jgi:hypothetical protein
LNLRDPVSASGRVSMQALRHIMQRPKESRGASRNRRTQNP